MIKRVLLIICVVIFNIGIISCSNTKSEVKIGVSFGVGEAIRWQSEKKYMEDHAKELGAEIEVRLNTTDKPKTQKEDCIELINSGIDVLILTPRNGNDVSEIIDYANDRGVKVISYARVILNRDVDLFVGYDSDRIGQTLGEYLSEKVDKGDYIILSGDKGDNNANLLYKGVMQYISQIDDDINIILDKDIPGWSPENAKKVVVEALKANGNKVDAILAPNDKIAGACVEALKELNINTPVVITGMDAELDAVKRIVSGEQDVTVYMNLKELANTAIDEAYSMAIGKEIKVNARFDNNTSKGVDSNLITGKLVTKQNVDKILIDSGLYTEEEVYGSQ